MRSSLVVIALLLGGVGCADASSEAKVCPPPEPDGFGAACAGDGECEGYLVCEEGSCAAPAAMVGGEPEALVRVEGSGAAYPVEVAAGELARARGSSGRPCIQPGWGLLLMWPEPDRVAITMEEVAFDLDLVFVDEAGVVIDVQRGRAGEERLYEVDVPVRWVWEVEPETLASGEVEVGARVSFEGLPD